MIITNHDHDDDDNENDSNDIHIHIIFNTPYDYRYHSSRITKSTQSLYAALTINNHKAKGGNSDCNISNRPRMMQTGKQVSLHLDWLVGVSLKTHVDTKYI